jgi:hypothetical protein
MLADIARIGLLAVVVTEETAGITPWYSRSLSRLPFSSRLPVQAHMAKDGP